MADNFKYPFDIEWLNNEVQFYHGPRKRMRKFLEKYSKSADLAFQQEQVVKFILTTYPEYVKHIDKLKFYLIDDDKTELTLRFFLLWCKSILEVREEFYERSEEIVAKTGWYPVVTGHRVFHHQRKLLDFIDDGFKKAMNKSNIEILPGLGIFESISNFSKGLGTSILVQTSNYDLVLDSGLSDNEFNLGNLRKGVRKWLFISHSHKDHTGGIAFFIKDKNFVISMSNISLELLLNAMNDISNIKSYLPSNFFYRLAPLWYRSIYRFDDGSSIETLPTYHFPGSMGFLFTFSDGKTLFYSGDFNLSASYLANKLDVQDDERFQFYLNRDYVDYGIIEGAFIGRKLGSLNKNTVEITEAVEISLNKGHNHILLTPPSDYGFFLFLHLYKYLVSNAKERVNAILFLDSQIITQLEILEWRMKRKQEGSLDNALLKFLKSRSTIAESVKIYDYNINRDINLKQMIQRKIPGVFIMDDQKLSDNIYLPESTLSLIKEPGLEISRIGKAATTIVQNDLFKDIIINNYDGDVWLLHSSEKLLFDYFINRKQSFGQVFLFHNFKARLDKFIKQLYKAGYDGIISPI